jgi:hypothetical protein
MTQSSESRYVSCFTLLPPCKSAAPALLNKESDVQVPLVGIPINRKDATQEKLNNYSVDWPIKKIIK